MVRKMKYNVNEKGQVKLVGKKKDVVYAFPVDVKDLVASGYVLTEDVPVVVQKKSKEKTPSLSDEGDKNIAVIGSALGDE
jgi:hypothetical protein